MHQQVIKIDDNVLDLFHVLPLLLPDGRPLLAFGALLRPLVLRKICEPVLETAPLSPGVLGDDG
jgi:hypothetical protein